MRAVRKRVAVPPLPADAPAPPLLDPVAGTQPRPTPWNAVYALDGGTTLEVHGVHGVGDQLHAVEVDEYDPDCVLVTLWLAQTDPPVTGVRPAIGYPFRARVTLSRPLGSRVAVDGALGTESEVRAAELAAAITWRSEMGLPTERELVAQLVDDARMPDGRLYGNEVLSDEESLWYRQALADKEAAANFAKGWLAAQEEDLDAHAEITWYQGGEFVQYVTGRAAELRAAAEREGIRRLRVEPVRYTYRQLDRFADDVRERLVAAGIDLLRSGPDVRSNTVAITIRGDADLARQVAAERAPFDAVTITSAT